MKKVQTTISINSNIREKLREQASEVGMDVSNYIAYLVMYKEDREKQEKRAKQLLMDLLKAKQ